MELQHVWLRDCCCFNWKRQLPGMVQVTLKSPPKSFPTFPSIDSFYWSSWRRKDCHDCHDGWCFFSVYIYIGISFRFSSLPGNISQQKSQVFRYLFKALVVSMVWSFQYVPWCPVLKPIIWPQFPIQKIATSRCTVRFLPNGDSSLQNQYGWSGLSLAYWLEETILLHSHLSKTWAVRDKNKKNYTTFSGVVYMCHLIGTPAKGTRDYLRCA